MHKTELLSKFNSIEFSIYLFRYLISQNKTRFLKFNLSQITEIHIGNSLLINLFDFLRLLFSKFLNFIFVFQHFQSIKTSQLFRNYSCYFTNYYYCRYFLFVFNFFLIILFFVWYFSFFSVPLLPLRFERFRWFCMNDFNWIKKRKQSQKKNIYLLVNVSVQFGSSTRFNIHTMLFYCFCCCITFYLVYCSLLCVCNFLLKYLKSMRVSV